ncbi:MAG: hypothetical protein IJG97_04215 [Bacilli bacterium]|jgi:hypothetical protein|nr:hypothetical protein [Bacilli bacterium]
MKNRMKKYLNEMRELDKKKKKLTKEELSDMLIHIKFYQHERLIHLLVTIFVGLGTIMFFGIAISNEMLAFVIVALITLILFFFYIFHYYFLENTVQELYDLYDSLKEKDSK